jgi:hypothetical protein
MDDYKQGIKKNVELVMACYKHVRVMNEEKHDTLQSR